MSTKRGSITPDMSLVIDELLWKLTEKGLNYLWYADDIFIMARRKLKALIVNYYKVWVTKERCCSLVGLSTTSVPFSKKVKFCKRIVEKKWGSHTQILQLQWIYTMIVRSIITHEAAGWANGTKLITTRSLDKKYQLHVTELPLPCIYPTGGIKLSPTAAMAILDLIPLHLLVETTVKRACLQVAKIGSGGILSYGERISRC